MSVKCKDITSFIEAIAPVHLAEEWDNVGLMLGSYNKEVKKVLVCLDVTSGVVEEAVNLQADLIISHHPLIFKPIKRLNEEDFKGRLIYRLIKNDISVYSAHTNLDVCSMGINQYLAEKLGLLQIDNLNSYRSENLYKIVVFVPEESINNVRNAMCAEGAGWIGNYSDCTFSLKGTGSYKPLEGTNPYIGTQNKLEQVNEFRLETVATPGNLKKVIDAMIDAHPYEEVAYDVYKLEQNSIEYGLGKIGVLDELMILNDFVKLVKERLDVKNIRMICKTDKTIKKVAVFCGAFDGNWSGIISKQADVVVTGDIKYNTAVDAAEMGLCVIDAGHFGTERIIVPRLAEMISKKFPQLSVQSFSMERDPFNYC